VKEDKMTPNYDEILGELSEDGYAVPDEGTPAYETLIEALTRAYKAGRRGA
jgi:hypothetical protein